MTTKHFTLVTLLVVGSTLSASTPARAQYDYPFGPLYCVVGVGDPDFGASGQWAFNLGRKSGSTDGLGNYFGWYESNGGVQCSGLTPGAWYSVDFSSGSSSSKQFKADKRGSADIAFRHETVMYAYGPDWYPGFYVYVVVRRLNPDGSSTVVLVN